jgi:hypothetical protein
MISLRFQFSGGSARKVVGGFLGGALRADGTENVEMWIDVVLLKNPRWKQHQYLNTYTLVE